MSEPKLSLLVDARNALYRAIYAAKSMDRRATTSPTLTGRVKYHHFVIFLRQLSSWIERLKPSSVHIFWDAPKSEVWRRAILKTYKDRTNSQYVEDISEELAITSNIASDIFQYMNVRQYSKQHMEADDLIYSAVCVLHPNKSIIISTDADMLQIPFTFSSSNVWNPKKQEITPVPYISPVSQKALMGDNSDNIKGYHGIGPKKAAVLLDDPQGLSEFFAVKGDRLYYTNLILIDLSLCPRMLANRKYITKIMQKPVCWDKKKIDELVLKYKIMGFISEETNLLYPFMNLS